MEDIEVVKTSAENTRAKILSAFKEHVLETGRQPVSVYKFAQSIQISEEEFYNYFTSFEGVKGGVWEQIFDQTVALMEAQDVYRAYSAKEKLLSFYFTWVEVLKKNRSYLLALYLGQTGYKKAMPDELRNFRNRFKDFANLIILEGKETDQIVERRGLSDKYEDALWVETLFILQFWLKDTSPGFEKTDAAIEKSVALVFDLIGKTAVDSLFDFAKFLYQSK
ncbi:TetR/AcrR family transcriptional regulator [Pontibacter qinzhouensis]|uniref:TetR/AcrR family transcriptional regulator n=1 Tax=Pontibacter qinzhouensis TaxID=2603253 RepID=A0A5C8KCV8_9BACT|nr:TetR family transcriptional regulator C-terminal domain-containing protein [Pontibacter qinzhouensis]TXK51599.1 TetR/AcrR family transcriptional regulator [Pontibacter qinzhouensis]